MSSLEFAIRTCQLRKVAYVHTCINPTCMQHTYRHANFHAFVHVTNACMHCCIRASTSTPINTYTNRHTCTHARMHALARACAYVCSHKYMRVQIPLHAPPRYTQMNVIESSRNSLAPVPTACTVSEVVIGKADRRWCALTGTVFPSSREESWSRQGCCWVINFKVILWVVEESQYSRHDACDLPSIRSQQLSKFIQIRIEEWSLWLRIGACNNGFSVTGSANWLRCSVI